jgi:tetratricopeptide (TPR) repeat protein
MGCWDRQTTGEEFTCRLSLYDGTHSKDLLIDAATLLKEAIKNSVDTSAVNNNLGNVLVKLGHTDQAVRAYETAILRDPLRIFAYRGLGRLYFDNNQLHQSKEVYAAALKIDPMSNEILSSLADICAALGDWREALLLYRKVSSPSLRATRPNETKLQIWSSVSEKRLRGISRSAIVPPPKSQSCRS